ncbi:unnamed protein product [Nezara viridula]|uniref:Uncharacterized protein n=1 Tax=Nezara viridula TaxID=85310 RepID=A0A9P0H322_NEZVI|nr:unnamed protein product [Nezara viridula]
MSADMYKRNDGPRVIRKVRDSPAIDRRPSHNSFIPFCRAYTILFLILPRLPLSSVRLPSVELNLLFSFLYQLLFSRPIQSSPVKGLLYSSFPDLPRSPCRSSASYLHLIGEPR